MYLFIGISSFWFIPMQVIRLDESHRTVLTAFFLKRLSTVMLAYGNFCKTGFTFEGEYGQAKYFGCFDDGELVGLAALCWNGNLILEWPTKHFAPLLRFIEERRERIKRVEGPDGLIHSIRTELFPGAAYNSSVMLKACLEDLSTGLSDDFTVVNSLSGDDLEACYRWRVQFWSESYGKALSDTAAQCRKDIDDLNGLGKLYLLKHAGTPLGMLALNSVAELAAIIGNVYVPPELRGKGHGKRLVRGSMLHIKGGTPIRELYLYTHNPIAERLYESCGFTRIGRYGTVQIS